MVETLVRTVPRIVLDTNVCLDLFVFRDPRCALLHSVLCKGEVEAVTSVSCRREWEIVLGYAHLPLNEKSRAASALEFDGLIKCLAPDEMTPRLEVRLPICRDRDDQKFLELARDAYADVLITKDKALLKLAKRNAKAGLFRILPPETWKPETLAL